MVMHCGPGLWRAVLIVLRMVMLRVVGLLGSLLRVGSSY
jgi:hypothetical protein